MRLLLAVKQIFLQPLLNVRFIFKRHLLVMPLFTVIILPLSGCASFAHLDDYKVKAWKKGAFTQPGMGWSEPGFETVIRDHIFFAKEAANGRPSMSGGGCGCN